MTDKRAYHPNGTAWIEFLEDPHTYIDNLGVRYLSGTSFCGQFFPKFNAESVSKRCAAGNNPKYAGRTPEDIRAEWAAEALRGSSEGDNTHMYAEGLMSGWPLEQVPEPISDRCRALFVQVRRAVKWLKSRFVFIAAEMVIFSPALGLSGMIDLVMFDPTFHTIFILDYKQNKEISRQGFRDETALSPIDHLQASDISKYGLQLSTYQYILDREKYFPNTVRYHRALIHLTPDNFQFIPLDFYDYEINLMLKSLKR